MAANAITNNAPVFNDDTNRQLFKLGAMLATGLGLAGVEWVTDTAAHPAGGNTTWGVFQAITDVVISSVSYKAGFGTGNGSGKTVKAGDRIYGRITSITLTSGTGLLYRTAYPGE